MSGDSSVDAVRLVADVLRQHGDADLSLPVTPHSPENRRQVHGSQNDSQRPHRAAQGDTGGGPQ